MASINKRVKNDMRFELSIRGIDTSIIKGDNQEVRKIDPKDQEAMDIALKEARKRKAMEFKNKS